MLNTNVTQSERKMQQQRRDNDRSYHNDMGFAFVAQANISTSSFAVESLEINKELKRELLQ